MSEEIIVTENTEIEAIEGFTEVPSEESASIWDRFAGVGYDHAGLMNIILLVVIFLAAKFVFKSFIMSSKRGNSDQSNNFAYAISNFSFFISLALILTSVGYGDITTSWVEGAGKTLTYAGTGLALLVLTGLIFDKIVIHKFNLNKQIAEGNVAAGIFDAGNFISAALIISSALMWQELKQVEGILAILAIYFISQLMFVAATFFRAKLFNNKASAIDFQSEIKENNVAVAIDFAGRRIGTALAIAAATKLLAYQDSSSLVAVVQDWAIVSVILLALLNIISWIISHIVFWQRNIYQDILANNPSSAMANVAIYISLGLIISNSFY